MESAVILLIKEKLRRYPLLYNIYAGFIILKRKLYLNNLHLQLGRNYGQYIGKPTLSYLEIDIVAHCNLKCSGCSHFSPLAARWFADIDEYEKDMARLSYLFNNIEAIRLLGGEPLLHPELVKFIVITRKLFKNARIAIATNGILLRDMTDEFWEACRINQIKINMSVYPPCYEESQNLVKWVKSKGAIIISDKQEKFRTVLNLKGDSDPCNAFEFCRSTAFVPYLFKGVIYPCSRPVVIDFFNRKFGFNIPQNGGINIHEIGISGWDILISINKPVETCRYCITSKHKFPWNGSELNKNDWGMD